MTAGESGGGLRRFNLYPGGLLEPTPNGPYVMWVDCERLMARVAELEGIIRATESVIAAKCWEIDGNAAPTGTMPDLVKYLAEEWKERERQALNDGYNEGARDGV